MSEQLGAYIDIKRLVDSNDDLIKYKHHTLIYKEGFVNFDNPWVQNQTIERNLGDMKEIIKKRGINNKVEQHSYKCRLKEISGEHASLFNY